MARQWDRSETRSSTKTYTISALNVSAATFPAYESQEIKLDGPLYLDIYWASTSGESTDAVLICEANSNPRDSSNRTWVKLPMVELGEPSNTAETDLVLGDRVIARVVAWADPQPWPHGNPMFTRLPRNTQARFRAENATGDEEGNLTVVAVYPI